MAAKDKTVRGMIAPELTEVRHPFKPSKHRRWIASMLLLSDEKARFLSLREAVRAARQEVRIRPMAQVFEVEADGTVREVTQPREESPSAAKKFAGSFALGAALTLIAAAGLGALMPAGGSLPSRRRRPSRDW